MPGRRASTTADMAGRTPWNRITPMRSTSSLPASDPEAPDRGGRCQAGTASGWGADLALPGPGSHPAPRASFPGRPVSFTSRCHAKGARNCARNPSGIESGRVCRPPRGMAVRVTVRVEDDVLEGKDVHVVAVGERAVDRMVQGVDLRGHQHQGAWTILPHGFWEQRDTWIPRVLPPRVGRCMG